MDTVFEISVLKEITEDVSTAKVIDGKEVTVTEKIKKLKPVKLALQKPGRRVSEAAEIYYARTIAAYIKDGLLSLHMLSKRYDNDGGPFNDLENKLLVGMSERKYELAKSYWETAQKTVKTDEEAKQEKKILAEITTVQQEIDRIQNPYMNIYNQTAEFKARNKAVNWWMVHLSLIEGADGKLERMFPGKDIFRDEDFEVQLDKLSDISTGKDAFMAEAVRKVTYFTSCWAGGAVFVPADDKPATIEEVKNRMRAALETYELEFPDYPFRDAPAKPEPVKEESAKVA